VSDGRPSILYVVSRFPNVPETFVVNEWWLMASHFRMEFASLVRMSETTLHPQTAELLPQVHFAGMTAWSTLRANARALARRPGRYLSTAGRVLAGSFRRPNGGVLKGAVAFWKGVRFAEIVQERAISHVHAHFISHSATTAWVISELTGVPFSITAHANDLYVRPALLDEKLREAEFVATISEYNREFIRTESEGAGRVELVHCGVDTEFFSFRRRESYRRLLCVGRLESTKGQVDLLHAFARARREVPDLTLDLIGDGADSARLERLRDQLGLGDELRFHGALRTDQVRAALGEADVFVLPSLRHPSGRMDGIPVALMEAMASGLAVITTRLSGIPELVIHEETGLLVTPESPDELAAAICQLVRDPELATRLARAARERVQHHFDLETEGNRLAGLFATTIAERRGSREEAIR
jgi:colanic acid/amylovoran biosynthesis glycosyltransferase